MTQFSNLELTGAVVAAAAVATVAGIWYGRKHASPEQLALYDQKLAEAKAHERGMIALLGGGATP